VPEATAELSAVGLQADVQSGLPFDRGDDARVVGQSHGAGSLVDRGTTVTLNTV
jgi:beta-lactam-binding protein with PASTA domain